MTNINITNLEKNIYTIIEEIIKNKKPVNISTKNGNVVILSEEDYNNLMETLYIESMPGMKADIIKAGEEPFEECIPEEEVDL